jgi:DNA-binding transcriptional LysR family regulator
MAERTSKLPSLDLLKGFEAAARHLNFTKAADELFVTQSAVSRQVQALEERLGVRLFVRQRRGMLLTHEGERLFRSVQGALRQMQEVIDSLSQRAAGNRVTLTSTMAFCALWLIPSSPALLERAGKPLRRAHDLAHYVLLDLEDPGTPASWLGWSNWFDALGVREVKPAGLLGFNYFDQIVRAALAGQGVALGRLPLIADLLQDGSLVAPLDVRTSTERAYRVAQAESARGRPLHLCGENWL